MGKKNNKISKDFKDTSNMRFEMSTEMGVKSKNIEDKVNIASGDESKYSKKTRNKNNSKNKEK